MLSNQIPAKLRERSFGRIRIARSSAVRKFISRSTENLAKRSFDSRKSKN